MATSFRPHVPSVTDEKQTCLEHKWSPLGAKLLTNDEARMIAANIAKLLGLLRRKRHEYLQSRIAAPRPDTCRRAATSLRSDECRASGRRVAL